MNSPDATPADAKARRMAREQTLPEEIANAVTHGVGLMLSCGCLAVGVVFASLYSSPRMTTSVAVYGATLCMLYLSSTLYHSLPAGRAKTIWNIIDHSSIYLLIAGTYTPITLALVTQSAGWGWSLFGVIWVLAIIGIVFQTLFIHRFRVFSTLTYLAMGWLVVIAIKPMWQCLGPRAFLWIALGGGCYTLGIIFYAWKRPRFTHAVWHLFVLAGSLCHFLGILLHVIMAKKP
jgi:hemolysin III